ncbi:MAG: LysR family transcriptional regulator [Janthinobacterium lividum]
MIDLIHVRSFLAVAEDLHFGRAARRLNMTQSPLSRQVQLLERELGVPLLVRANRAVKLTPAGRAFLAEASALLGKAETAVQAARRTVRGRSGVAAVGFIGACSYGFLPRLVAAARRELPDVTLSFHELTSAQQVEALARGQLDLALARPVPPRRGLESACVQREGLALALSPDHKLAGRRRPLLRQLEGEDFIMYSEEGLYMHDMLTAAFAASGVEPRFVQRLSHAQAILSLVSAGLGIAIVPEEARNACFDNVLFRPIQLGAGQAAELHAIWRAGDSNEVLPPLRGLTLRLLGSGSPLLTQ